MPKSKAIPPVSIRLDPMVDKPVREIARRTKQSIGRVINSLVEAALRMDRFPGIMFVEGPAGRRAHLAGTGLDVWEIVALLRDYGSLDEVLTAFPGLTKTQVGIARAYAQAYPEEVDEFLNFGTRSPEEIAQEFPHVTIRRV